MAQKTPAGFRFSSGTCCCCWDYYIQTVPGGFKYPIGFRRMRTSGDYENLVIDIDEKSVAGRPPSNGLGQPQAFRFDYRNKLAFYHAAPFPRPTGNDFVIMRADASLNHKTQIASYRRSTAPALPPTSPAINGLIACDYVNRRVLYVRLASITETDPVNHIGDVVQEIRRVDYDGGNDTLVHSETSTGELDYTQGVVSVVYEPTTGRVYFATARSYRYGAGANIYAYLKYVNATDGSDYTTLFSHEDSVNPNGDYSVTCLGISGRHESLLWVLRHQVDNVWRIWASSFDGISPYVLYDPLTVTPPPQSNIRYSERDDYLLYNRTPDPLASLRVAYRVDWGDATEQPLFDSRQLSLTDEETTFGTTGEFGAQFGCRKEITGHDYMGAG